MGFDDSDLLYTGSVFGLLPHLFEVVSDGDSLIPLPIDPVHAPTLEAAQGEQSADQPPGQRDASDESAYGHPHHARILSMQFCCNIVDKTMPSLRLEA